MAPPQFVSNLLNASAKHASVPSRSQSVSSPSTKFYNRKTAEHQETSPVSVVEEASHPANNSNESAPCSPSKRPRSRECQTGFLSVVMMGANGAEVALEQPLQSPPAADTAPVSPLKAQLNGLVSANTPQDKTTTRPADWRCEYGSTSLLDDEMTPTPAKRERQIETPFATKLCCSSTESPGQCWSLAEDSSLAVVNLEDRISAFLGSPNGLEDWCSGWQAWMYFEMDVGEQEATTLKEDVKKVLRNRAHCIQSRSQRIQQLKGDIHPFAATPKQQEDKLPSTPTELTRNRSLQHPRGKKATASSINESKEMPAKKQTVSVWDAVLCTVPTEEEESPFQIRSRGIRHDDDDLYYDSDPEEITRRRSSKTSKMERPGPRAALSDHSIKDANSDQVVKARVQELIGERYTMVWHPSTKRAHSGSPVAVKMWIEKGQQLNRSLLHPKLVWQLTFPRSGRNKGLPEPNEQGLYTCDLLDITRILEVNRVDRRKYPFAVRKKSLLIQSLDQTMLFQAVDNAERNRFVHGLKLAVARLGAKIVAEDDSLFAEYFALADASIPGEAPEWHAS